MAEASLTSLPTMIYPLSPDSSIMIMIIWRLQLLLPARSAPKRLLSGNEESHSG